MAAKKIAIVLLLVILMLAAIGSMLPTTHGIGRKSCLAAHLVAGKWQSLTQPAPKPVHRGNGNADLAGDSQGAERVPVLMYHYVVPEAHNREPHNRSIINLEAFERGIEYLHREGYYAATLSELEDYVHGYIRLPERTVVITFDDGYENNYVYAYPVLRKYGFRAAVFLIGSRVQEQTTAEFDPARSTYVSEEQIEASGDVFEFHSHTYDLHYKIDAYCGEQRGAAWDGELLADDVRAMKRSGIDTPYFAYPFGDFGGRIVHRLVDDGYRMAFTVAEGFVRPGDRPMLLKRFAVASDTDLAELFANEERP